MASVTILNEVITGENNQWRLCFQWCEFNYDNGEMERGYRFIWRRPDGTLQPARGQARIPSAEDLFALIQMASSEGWFIRVENNAI